MSAWLFGYGSLIWRPGFDYLDSARARLHGFERRFWQGSHDHRGVPTAPGRVVTLVETAGAHCDGVAYQISDHTHATVLAELDYREKNGYARLHMPVQLLDRDNCSITALIYLATADNFAYLGPAPVPELARQISASSGPSGHNRDYLFDLARALRDLPTTDAHVFELEQAVRTLESSGDPIGHRLQP